MNKSRVSLAAAVLAALVVAAPVQAHEPPAPRDFETRVLVDQNDDCGGHGGSDNCRGTHDLVGFNVREAYDASLGHVVIFTLIADEGDTSQGTLTDTFSYTAGGASRTIVFETADDASFTVAGASRVDGPRPLRNVDGTADGTRFTVDAVFQRGDLGLQVGDRLRDFMVEAKAGSTRGDVMPGGYVSPLTGNAQDGADPSTQYARPSYTMAGPTQYVQVTPDDQIQVEAGTTAFVDVQVKNLLSDMGQTVRFSAQAEGVQVGFHDPGAPSGAYPATYEESVAKGREILVHLTIGGGGSGASGQVEVTVATDLGGRSVHTVSYTITEPGEEPADPAEDPEEDAPAAGLLPAIGLIALAASRRR